MILIDIDINSDEISIKPKNIFNFLSKNIYNHHYFNQDI